MKQRLRIAYDKQDEMRYIGHLDMQKVWERAVRRARLPLTYSQGFHPQPKLSQACPLPLGFTSRAELIDIWLEDGLPLEQVQSGLQDALPNGIRIRKIEEIDLQESSLQNVVASCTYEVTFLDDLNMQEVAVRTAALLQQSEIIRERRGKQYDLRPLIELIFVQTAEGNGTAHLLMQLSARPGATGRPEEVLDALGLGRYRVNCERAGLIFAGR